MSKSIDSVKAVGMAESATTVPCGRGRRNRALGSATASRRIVAVLLLVIPLGPIGLDVYAPALPKMAIEFAASHDFVQNTITVYLLGMSVAFPPAGLIADAIGRKRVLLFR